jgi:HEAT repeat protein
MRVQTRCLVLVGLVACGCSQEKSTDQLLADLKSPQERDRLIAVRSLAERKGDAARVVPALIEALTDKKDDIRLSAAIGLGTFGDQAKDAIPALKAAQHDSDARIRKAAGTALARIDPQLTSQPVPSTQRGK